LLQERDVTVGNWLQTGEASRPAFQVSTCCGKGNFEFVSQGIASNYQRIPAFEAPAQEASKKEWRVEEFGVLGSELSFEFHQDALTYDLDIGTL
jgi:hypothetical protein